MLGMFLANRGQLVPESLISAGLPGGLVLCHDNSIELSYSLLTLRCLHWFKWRFAFLFRVRRPDVLVSDLCALWTSQRLISVSRDLFYVHYILLTLTDIHSVIY